MSRKEEEKKRSWGRKKFGSLHLEDPRALVLSVVQLGNRHLAELAATWQQATWQGTGVDWWHLEASKMGRTFAFHTNPTTDFLQLSLEYSASLEDRKGTSGI